MNPYQNSSFLNSLASSNEYYQRYLVSMLAMEKHRNQQQQQQQQQHSYTNLATNQQVKQTVPTMTTTLNNNNPQSTTAASTTSATIMTTTTTTTTAASSAPAIGTNIEHNDNNIANLFHNYRQHQSPISGATQLTPVTIQPAAATNATYPTMPFACHALMGQHAKRKRRHRTIFSEEQLAQLENVFYIDQYPDVALRDRLASQLNLKETRIEVWFKNRRAKFRKQQRDNHHQYHLPAATAAAAAAMISRQHQLLYQQSIMSTYQAAQANATAATQANNVLAFPSRLETPNSTQQQQQQAQSHHPQVPGYDRVMKQQVGTIERPRNSKIELLSDVKYDEHDVSDDDDSDDNDDRIVASGGPQKRTSKSTTNMNGIKRAKTKHHQKQQQQQQQQHMSNSFVSIDTN